MALAAEDKGVECSWVPLDQPAQAAAHHLIHGASVEAHNRNRAELQRLQCLDAVTNKAYITAKADASQIAAALAELKQVLSDVHAGTCDLRPDTLRRNLQDHQRLLEQALIDFELTIDGCHRLCDTAASVQHTSILLGDYNLKLARQEYLTSKQDALIDHLLQQRARKELMKALMRQDKAAFTTVHALLEAIRQHLDSLAGHYTTRTKAMVDAKAQHSSKPKRMVHSTDSSIARLHKILQVCHSTLCRFTCKPTPLSPLPSPIYKYNLYLVYFSCTG